MYFCGNKLPNDDSQKSNFSSQKRPKFQILSYRSHIYLKRKLRTCTIKIQPEKVGFLAKNQIFFRFFNFSPNARGPPKIFDVQFCEIFKNKFQKWLLWDLSGIERNKVKNFGEPSPIPLDTAEGFTVWGAIMAPPPCRIGLRRRLCIRQQICSPHKKFFCLSQVNTLI